MITSAEDKMTLDNDEDGEAEEILEGSQLPVHVIQRVLTRQKKEEPVGNDWLHNNIFHTRVKHLRRSLNLIIDSKSGMNVISQKVVQKLKLPVDKHPQTYWLSWVDDTSIPVKYQCLITFSVGQHYIETVCCDMILMKACHLLLGRPWLYDRWVRYDGYRNT